MRSLDFAGLSIVAPTTRCAHGCRYCSIGATKFTDIPFERFSILIERFVAWRQARGLPDFVLWFFSGNAFEYEPQKMQEVIRLWRLTGQPSDGIATGGLKWREEGELRSWLESLAGMGITRLHSAFAGMGRTHDRWNARRGDFDYLTRIQRIGAQLGMSLSQSLFMTKNTLPSLEALIDCLDDIGGEVAWRWAFPFAYLGRAVYHEKERVDEADRDQLPPRVERLCGRKEDRRSEREWIDVIGGEQDLTTREYLHLNVNEANLSMIEAMSCDEILADLKSRTSAAYAAIPTARALCEEKGDPTNTKIYGSRDDVERLWLKRYLDDHPIRFESGLTRFGFEKDLKKSANS